MEEGLTGCRNIVEEHHLDAQRLNAGGRARWTMGDGIGCKCDYGGCGARERGWLRGRAREGGEEGGGSATRCWVERAMKVRMGFSRIHASIIPMRVALALAHVGLL